MKVLVLNCGSSSIKYQLFEMPEARVSAKGSVQRIGEQGSTAVQQSDARKIEFSEHIADHQQALAVIQRMLTDPHKGAIESMDDIGACGHRVVHGGESFTGSVNVTDDLEKVIEEYCALAPLHNPPNLIGIRAARKMLGTTPQIACFDTAFHQTIPDFAFLYALPYEMYSVKKIRKYGFHGTSHRYVARRAAQILGKGKYDVDVITCHLGNGCSITAVKNGKSVDTSMGLTPLEGVVMGTRTGDLDPAIIFHLCRNGYNPQELDAIFNKKSGLLGISGVSNDVRDLEERAPGDKQAQLALDIFAYRIKKYIGAYIAVLNGCDAIVLTGGIGENAVRMRARILAGMNNLGITIDEKLNRETIGIEGDISTAEARIRALVIPTNEEKAIAFDTYSITIGENA